MPCIQRGWPACLLGAWLWVLSVAPAPAQSSERVINGGFEDGLTGWQFTGEVSLETNQPLNGRASARLGPGPGSLSQRIETGSGNDFTLAATILPEPTNGWVLALRFLDQQGREVMRVDSRNDIASSQREPNKFKHYMKAHPLTKWIELAISKDTSTGSVLVDQVSLDMTDENGAGLQPACNLAQAMHPFWLGTTVYNEAVLLVSHDGQPATGRLMFEPSRILSVRDYGLATNYTEGPDYVLEGRTLRCAPASRMTWVREEALPQGELKWNSLGGKQVMVSYEHTDTWHSPHLVFARNSLPHALKRLQAHAPLRIVAYGDSITHGVGESRLAHIPPFLPPWPELVVLRLKAIYQDEHIQLFNSAQSGADSNWGRKFAGRMVASLNPDLVLVAFGQNDFWSVPAGAFEKNIRDIVRTVHQTNPRAEFVLVSTARFDPAYTSNADYWKAVSEYAARLKALAGPGVQFVDMTAISEAVYAAKKPKDCLNDPLHPNDYLARWYAQSVLAALVPASESASASTASRERASMRDPRQLSR